MSLWNSMQKDYNERAPLSAHDDDDDEEEPPLPPYSDTPGTPYTDNPPQDHNNGGGAPVRRVNGRSNGNTPASAHKAITINNGEDDDDDEDPGFGEGDFYRNGSGGNSSNRNNNIMYSSTPSKHKHRSNKPTRYRTGLICAYLQYCLTCCGAIAGGRAKRIFMCLFYTVLFVTILVCASAIGYIIARDGSSPTVEDDAVVKTDINNSAIGGGGGGGYAVPTADNGGFKTFDKQKNAAKLPPPPADLHDICSDWITASGRKKCQAECSMADCCSLPASNRNSCWEEQAEECATYRAACMALELHKDDATSGGNGGNSSTGGGGVIGSKTILYAPPSNLSVLCSSTSLATPEGFDLCAGVCRPSRCCYPDNFDCNLADDRYCEDYEDLCAPVAESWRGSGHAVAPPPPAPSGSSSSSTSTSGGGTTSTPAIANGVMTKCNAANLNPPDECIQACWPGACCYASSSYPPILQLFDEHYGAGKSQGVVSCAASVGFCQQYGSCEHLNHMKDVAGWNSDEVNYVVDVSTPCKAEHIAQFGALQCSNVCQPAHCCFSGEYACDDVQLGHLKCEDYRACQVLYPGKTTSTKELLKLAERIDDVCSESSLKTVGGLAECKDVCDDHLCCLYQDGCANDPDKNCLAYAGCEAYYNLPTDSGPVATQPANSNGGNSGTDNVVTGFDEFFMALEETCSEENLKTINGIYKCHNKCQSHLCCFAGTEQAKEDCSNARPVACSAYEPCKRLVQPVHGDDTVASLEPDDVKKIVFDACYFGDDPLKITEEMVQKCHNVCASRLCCFSDYLLQSSCRSSMGDDECELYSMCEQLVSEDGSEVDDAMELRDNEFDVEHLCTNKVSEDENLFKECKKICVEKRSCCFDVPSYSCYDMEKDWCDEYKACEKVDLKFTLAEGGTTHNSNGAATPEQIEKQVYDACYFGDDESVVTQELVNNCRNVCKPRMCCFDRYKLEGSCRATVGDECELFSLCEQLITADGGIVTTFIELDLQEFGDDFEDNTSTPEQIEKQVYDACYFGTDESKVTQELITNCHNVCKPRLCCFDSYIQERSCRATVGDDECELFSLCEQLINDEGVEITSVAELDTKEFNDDNSNALYAYSEVIEKQVYDACYFGNDESKLTQELVMNCHKVCKSRLCCFDNYRLQASCRATVGDEECELFSLCEQLITDDGGVVKTFLELDLKEFDDDNDKASVSTDIEKEVYDACYFGTDESKVTQDLVNNCHNVCKPRLCCFDSYKLEASCRWSVGDEECELFSLCEQLITADGGVVKTFLELDLQEFDDDNDKPSIPANIEKEVYDACYFGTDESKVTQTLVNNCRDVCKTRLCCFDSYKLEASCRATVGDEECELFSLCEQLITADGGVVKTFLELDLQEFDDDNDKPSIPANIEKEVYDACYFGTDESKVTQTLVNNCRDVCKTRLCCFDSYKLEASCRATVGDEECELFSLCEQLITADGGVVKTFLELDLQEFDDEVTNKYSASGPGSSVQFPSGNSGLGASIKDQLEVACSDSAIKTLDGIQTCHSKCQTHLCCFTTDPILADQNCSGLIPAGCDAYEPCKKLVSPPSGEAASSIAVSTREEIEQKVYDACYFGTDPSRVTEELVTRCLAVCAQRLCCFSDYNLQSSCRAAVGDDECNLYSLCDQLVTENGVASDALELDEKEFYVDQLCTDKVSYDQTLYEACSETCERRSCCFETDQVYSCYNLEKDWCDEYKSCSVVGYNFLDGSSSNTDSLNNNAVGLVDSGGSSSSSSELEFYDYINSVCSSSSLKTLEGVELCFNKCQPYLCCFPEVADEMDWDCEEFREEECDAYMGCEALVATHDLWTPPSKSYNKYAVKLAVNEACILGSGMHPSEEWVSNCHQKCETRMCCLADTSIRSSCQDAVGAEECNDYSACKVLVGGASRAADDINEVCSNVDDATSFVKCQAQCKTRECCFEDVHKFSCYHLEKEWCDAYEICGMVGLSFSSSSNALPLGQTSSTTSAANALESPSQTAISAPTPAIAPTGPSFTSSVPKYNTGPSTNYNTPMNNAVPATLPQVVNTPPKTSEGDSDSELLILARACNEDQLESDPTECRMLCKGSECCFTSHIENNCSLQAGMQAFCLAHMLCADLYVP